MIYNTAMIGPESLSAGKGSGLLFEREKIGLLFQNNNAIIIVKEKLDDAQL